MTTRRKPIFARNKRNVSQPHWLWVALSLCVLIAVTLFDVGQSHHSFAGQVKDFWAEPSYAQLLLAEQKRIHDYVVADKGTAKEALDALIKDWQKVFKDDGKL